MLRMWIFSAWILGHVEANNAQLTGSIDDANQGIQHIGGVFCACTGLPGLVPDSIDALIYTITMAHRPDLLNGVSLAKVNRDSTDLLHLVKPVQHMACAGIPPVHRETVPIPQSHRRRRQNQG